MLKRFSPPSFLGLFLAPSLLLAPVAYADGALPAMLRCFDSLAPVSVGPGNEISRLANGPATPPTLAVPTQLNGTAGFYLFTEGKIYFETVSSSPVQVLGRYQHEFHVPHRWQENCGFDDATGFPRVLDCKKADPKNAIVTPDDARLIKDKPGSAMAYQVLRQALITRAQSLVPRVQAAVADFKAKRQAYQAEISKPPITILGIQFELLHKGPAPFPPQPVTRDSELKALQGCFGTGDPDLEVAVQVEAGRLDQVHLPKAIAPAKPNEDTGQACPTNGLYTY